MKLINKLLLLVGGAALLFSGSVAAYLALLAPVETMQAEYGVFQTLGTAAAQVQLQANLLLVKPLEAQEGAFALAVQDFQKVQQLSEGTEVLRASNPQLKEAVEAVANLGELSQENLAGVAAAVISIRDSCVSAEISWGGLDWTQIYQVALASGTAESGDVKYALANLASQVLMLNDTLDVTRQVIVQNGAAVYEEIGRLKDQSSAAGLMVITVALLLALSLSFVLARNITGAVRNLGVTLEKAGAGDLRHRGRSSRRDELGNLARNVDALLDSLTGALHNIQASSAENLEVKNLLVRSVALATTASNDIEGNTKASVNQLEEADERVQTAVADLQTVVALFSAFRVQLVTQGTSVVEANGIVSELTLAMRRVAGYSSQNQSAVGSLLAESERGRAVFEESFSKVSEISDSVSEILNLVALIAEIAGQTNILALNAAIEAAHAGEAGRGFAVVADEISKLAAASSSSSAQIATTVRAVVSTIRDAGATKEKTLKAFESIEDQIGKVSATGQRIFAETEAIDRGAQQIGLAMDSLASSHREITGEAGKIGTVAAKLEATLEHVRETSHAVVGNISGIAAGFTEIAVTLADVSTQAQRLGRTSGALDEAVRRFQIDGDL